MLAAGGQIMQTIHAALAVFGVFVSSALPFSPVSLFASSWLDEVGVGDTLVTTFGGASFMIGALVACARHCFDGAPVTPLKLS
jgi:hypothetical protein